MTEEASWTLLLKKRLQLRRHALGFAAQAAALGFPLLADHRKLAALRNVHAGKRVFILGNGPSLRIEDLDRLHESGEFSMGANRVFKAFDRTAWRPTYYLSVDKLLEQEAVDIIHRCATTAIFPTYFPRRDDPKIQYIRIFNDEYAKPWPRFSSNAFAGVYQGFTVTYIAIQMAVFMGFHDIYLLGVDHNYTLSADNAPVREIQGLKVYETKNEKNYFLPDYHLPGDSFFQHKPNENELAYIAARRHAEPCGFRIFNATRGGHLEVFERVSFDSLF